MRYFKLCSVVGMLVLFIWAKPAVAASNTAPSCTFNIDSASVMVNQDVKIWLTNLDQIRRMEVEWGDGQIDKPGDYSFDATHQYTQAGNKTIKINLITESGQTYKNVCNGSVQVNAPTAPTATLIAEPISGTVPLKVSFWLPGDSITGGADMMKVHYGDGWEETYPQYGFTGQYQYNQTGVFTLTIDLRTPDGMWWPNVAHQKVEVRQQTPITADVSIDPQSGQTPLEVNVQAVNPSRGVNTLKVDWGIGAPKEYGDHVFNASFQYTQTGTYTVILYVKADDDGQWYQVGSATITVTSPDSSTPTPTPGPTATPVSNPVTAKKVTIAPLQGMAPHNVNVEAQDFSRGVNTLKVDWSVGDPKEYGDHVFNASFQYTQTGTFTVTLYVRADDDGQWYQVGRATVTVTSDQTPDATTYIYMPVISGRPIKVTFTADAVGGNLLNIEAKDPDTPVKTMRITWGDGSAVETFGDHQFDAQHHYAKSGQVTVVLALQTEDNQWHESVASVTVEVK